MPRITPCRCLRLLLLPWIVMFALWFFLPSFAIPASERKAYIKTTLAHGDPVITVHKWDASFERTNNHGQMSAADTEDTTNIAIRWQLLPRPPRATKDRNDVVLKIGDQPPLLVLADLEALAENLNHNNSGEWAPYFGTPFRMRGIWAGDTEHVYNMPWFHSADKVLFHHEFHGFSAYIDLCTVVPEQGVIELWKRETMQMVLRSTALPTRRYGEKGTHEEDDGKEYREDLDRLDGLANRTWAGEIRRDALKKLEPYRQEYGLLATFKDGDFKSVGAVGADIVGGELPSRSFSIRRALIFPLGPMPMVFEVILVLILPWVVMTVGPPFLAVYVVSVVFLWLYSGRPAFLEWSEDYWLTRFWFSFWCCKRRRKATRRRRVWGPTGPVLDVEKYSTQSFEGGEMDVRLQRPSNAKLLPL